MISRSRNTTVLITLVNYNLGTDWDRIVGFCVGISVVKIEVATPKTNPSNAEWSHGSDDTMVEYPYYVNLDAQVMLLFSLSKA